MIGGLVQVSGKIFVVGCNKFLLFYYITSVAHGWFVEFVRTNHDWFSKSHYERKFLFNNLDL